MNDFKNTTLLKKDDKLTNVAKFLFGENIVLNAYYSAFFNEKSKNMTLDNVINRLDLIIEKRKDHVDYIDQDAISIIIDFVGGKSVSFSNSEWGSMCKYSHADETYRII